MAEVSVEDVGINVLVNAARAAALNAHAPYSRFAVGAALIGGAMGADGRPEGSTPVGPCGRCRQVINEAAQLGHRDVPVYCASANGEAVERHLLSELLPFAFGPKDLGLA
jgi:cytidine deaminase